METIIVAMLAVLGTLFCVKVLIEVLDLFPEQQKEKPLDMEELGEDLCKWCPLDEYLQGSKLHPNGHYSCEGCRCQEAYEQYLEDFSEKSE